MPHAKLLPPKLMRGPRRFGVKGRRFGVKGEGEPCESGETASRSRCIPASGDVSKVEQPNPPERPKAKGRTFSAPAEIHQWGKRAYASWARSLKPHHLETIDAYQSGYYQKEDGPNELLRNPPESTPIPITNAILRLGYALKGAQTPEDLTVYRGISTGLEGLTVGGVYQDNGFMSTSLDKNHVEGIYADPELHGDQATLLEIFVPKGSNGAYVDASGKGKTTGESEMLFNRGQKLKVVSITKDDKGRNVVRAEMLK